LLKFDTAVPIKEVTTIIEFFMHIPHRERFEVPSMYRGNNKKITSPDTKDAEIQKK
jgi:hypothetical protein